ncbi:Mfa1 family fimbria major subunit [Bacteroides sp. GD17]|jgi:hypothetical protein|uniref:Mfa1 family fimbria major subunit n=1 Tax=Bacteroides sp. GD17 TaxID=3139826 RepID=UPI0025D78C4F|nr:Mfa1 family fimbria major subunit [uncultured Bacteroides sp.]
MNKFKFATMAFAALTLGLTSCTNDDAMTGQPVELGQPTAMGLTISTPAVPRTYGLSTDGNATDDEIELKTINVLIYSETSIPGSYILEKNASLVVDDFDAVTGTPDTYKLKSGKEIATTTGNKKIFVAMNYPTPAALPAVNSPLTSLANFTHSLSSADELYSNGFTMFSAEEKLATLVAETTPGVTPAANQITVGVKRLVAKVTVREDITRDGSGKIMSQGGELTNLEFALGNANKSIYPLQKRVGTSPAIVVQDPNWSSFAAGDFFSISSYAPGSTAYDNIENVSVAATALDATAVYAPENTAATHPASGDNLTYVSVRAQYAPEFFCEDDGTSKGPNTAAAKSFWTVVATDGSIYYFDVEADADTFLAANPTYTKSDEYVDGLCYFRAYINKNGTADSNISGSTAAKFDVLRNNFYDMVVKSIKAPGSATDKGGVAEETTLMVDVQVEPWAVVSDNYDL